MLKIKINDILKLYNIFLKLNFLILVHIIYIIKILQKLGGVRARETQMNYFSLKFVSQ